MEEPRIGLREERDWAEITLNRPPLNIVDLRLLEELSQCLEQLRPKQDLKLVVIRGAGKCFSAGVDVEVHLPPHHRKMLDSFHGVLRLLRDLGIPVAALVHSHALGGGCELALACDFLYSEVTAVFGQPEIRLGVFAPAASAMLPRRVGWMRASEMLLTGENFTARQIADWGLAETVPEGGLDNARDTLRRRLAAHSAASLRCAKRAMVEARRVPAVNALTAAEKIYHDELMRTHDAEEGLRAFLDKRPPRWENR